MRFGARKLLLILALSFLTGAILTVRPLYSKGGELFSMQAPTDAASMENGKEVYEQKCLWCHGEKGDGKGITYDRVNPKPRDFTKGTYKFRTTQSGEIPTDYDIFRSITKGLSGTTMYSWEKALPEKDRWDLVAYVKTFSDRFKNEQYTKDKVLTYHAPGEKGEPYPGDPGKADANLLKEGDQVYHDKNGAKCFQCHGDHGRGNGVSADSLVDDWNNRIWPADLTKSYDLRGSDSAQDIYRDLSTGVSGSPMPSYRGALDADDKKDLEKRWAVSYYVKSLQAPRKLGALVKAPHLSGDLPTDPKDSRWDKIDWIDVPLAGQVIMDPREFTPSVDNISIKACYNDKNVAILVYWEDRTKNTTTDKKKYPDGTQIQFPVQIPKDPAQDAKPYFVLGDKEHPVDLWSWNAQEVKAAEANAWGSEKIEPKPALGVSAKAIYDDGMWKVVFTRPLGTASKDRDLQFQIGQFIPIAFSVWDGDNGEHEMQKSLSAWYYLLLIPPTSSKVYIAPAIAVLVGIGLQLWGAKKSREYSKQI